MSIGGRASADQAGLPSNELEMLLVSDAPLFWEREHALVDLRAFFDCAAGANALTLPFE
jgi:hypothetical protein